MLHHVKETKRQTDEELHETYDSLFPVAVVHKGGVCSGDGVTQDGYH